MYVIGTMLALVANQSVSRYFLDIKCCSDISSKSKVCNLDENISLICNIDIAILVEDKPVYATLFFFGYTVGGPCVGHLQIYHKDMLAGNDCLKHCKNYECGPVSLLMARSGHDSGSQL